MNDYELYRIARFNNLIVWQRVHWKILRLPKYLVGEDDRNKIMKEFRTFAGACAWARKNKRPGG